MMIMKDTEKYLKLAELMALEKSGALTEKDREELKDLMSDEANKQLYQEIKAKLVLNTISDFSAYNTISARQKIEKRLSKTGRQILLQVFKYSAAIAIPISIVLGVLHFSTQQNDQVAVQMEVIHPGESKALLYLADGSAIDLKEQQGGELEKINGTSIINDSIGLSYIAGNVNNQTTSMNKVVTPVGGEYSIILSDGTKVWLNAKSELSYPVKFTGHQRKVILKGEAYFEVSENKDHPFIVEADKVNIQVLGTQFNVMAYDDEKSIATTLVEGSVKVYGKGSGGITPLYTLQPGKQAMYSRTGNTIEVKEVETSSYVAWKDGKFMWEAERLDVIMRQLARWYDVDIFYTSQKYKEYRFNARLKRYDKIEDILSKLELTADIKFKIDNRTVVVQ